MEDDLFVGPEPEPKKFRRPVGRPTKQAAAREATRLRVQKFRSKQDAPIKMRWETNRAALAEPEREAFEAQQAEVALLASECNEVISHVLEGKELPEDLFPDLLWLRVSQFNQEHPTVHFWCPDSTVGSLDQKDFNEWCDDDTYRSFGYRCHIVHLFWREFTAAVFEWAEAHPEDCDGEVHEAITVALARLEPIPEPKYLAERPVYQSEREREQAIATKEMVEAQQARFNNEFIKWKSGQINQEANNGQV
jgi:hypothetical protein